MVGFAGSGANVSSVSLGNGRTDRESGNIYRKLSTKLVKATCGWPALRIMGNVSTCCYAYM